MHILVTLGPQKTRVVTYNLHLNFLLHREKPVATCSTKDSITAYKQVTYLVALYITFPFWGITNGQLRSQSRVVSSHQFYVLRVVVLSFRISFQFLSIFFFVTSVLCVTSSCPYFSNLIKKFINFFLCQYHEK